MRVLANRRSYSKGRFDTAHLWYTGPVRLHRGNLRPWTCGRRHHCAATSQKQASDATASLIQELCELRFCRDDRAAMSRSCLPSS